MFTSINPATGETIATHEAHDEAEVERRVALAARDWRAWRTSSLDQRVAVLTRCAALFEADKARLAEMATREMGKTLASAVAEVEKCVAGFRYYAGHGPGLLATTRVPTSSGTAEARWLPIGPVLAIMPWNFPYWQVIRFAAPTILAGNVGLLKHASNVQGCAALIEELIGRAAKEADAPAGLFQILGVPSSRVGPLIADPRIAAVTLTGSEEAGAKVAAQAGEALKKVVLELGGSDPFIVMPSADLEKAARTAVTARLQNAGQSCICAKRMIVHADVYDAFLDRFVAGMAAARVGDPMLQETVVGPLSSPEQRETVLRQVAEAKRLGARLLTGGEALDGPGAFMSPGVLVDLDPDTEFARQEVFGPVATVFRVADLDAAIGLANNVPFGLGASVWTSDDAERERFARDIEAGMVAVNQMLASTPEAPFGGVKRSGHGRELGPWGLHEFMNLKAVLVAKDAGG